MRPAREAVRRRPRHDIGRRPLQHRDMRRGLCHRWHQRHRGRAAADHHHALALIVEVVGPVLGMHDATGEVVDAIERGREPRGIIIIAAAHVQEAAGQRCGRTFRAGLDVERPPRIGGRPGRGEHADAEADVPIDPERGGGVGDIVADRLAPCDRLLARPGSEREAERVHVRVRSDPGIAEQVPGAADRVARLEDRIGLSRALRLHPVGRIDTRQPGTDDQDVVMRLRGGWGRCVRCCGCHVRVLRS